MIKYGLITFIDGRRVKFQWLPDVDTLISKAARLLSGGDIRSIPPDYNKFIAECGVTQVEELSKQWYDKIECHGAHTIGDIISSIKQVIENAKNQCMKCMDLEYDIDSIDGVLDYMFDTKLRRMLNIIEMPKVSQKEKLRLLSEDLQTMIDAYDNRHAQQSVEDLSEDLLAAMGGFDDDETD